MKYIGFFVILLSVLIFSDSYSKHTKKRLLEYEGFLSFISHVRLQMSCFLKPTKRLAEGFYSKPLAESGFLEYIGECENIYEAYKKAENRLSLSKEEREILSALFSSFGEGYLNDELQLIDAYRSQLEEGYLRLKSDAPKSSKLVSTLSVTAAVGFLILVI